MGQVLALFGQILVLSLGLGRMAKVVGKTESYSQKGLRQIAAAKYRLGILIA
jgi:hypothetical protein